MSKTWLIIKREYWTRVKKKSFVFITLLVPLLIVGLMAAYIGIMLYTSESKTVGVVDESRQLSPFLKNSNEVSYTVINNTPIDSVKFSNDYDAVLHIPEFNLDSNASFNLYSNDQLGLGAQSKIQNDLNSIAIDRRINASGIDVSAIDKLRQHKIQVVPINKEGKESRNEIAAAIGYLSGMLLYVFMFLYGFNVMRSVMEEKTNRIAEIIISSVKPFQLMIGKIIGVALVGLTQFAIWMVLIAIFYSILGVSVLSTGMMDTGGLTEVMSDSTIVDTSNAEMAQMVQSVFFETNWLLIIGWFLFYFLGGYFIYASLFAAVGSLVDEDAQEAQQLTFPITLPIIIGFLMLTSTIQDPNGAIAVFGSIFPLTSPIVMMARIPYGITGDMMWQLPLSVALLIIGFFFTTWLAAKVYRTGILMYGKKISLKEVGKWLFIKR